MVEYIPAPDPRALLPPLLACLPASFASPHPPPALLSLLSPILRQRVQLLRSLSSSSSESWLRLLCWDTTRAERVENIVGNATFEPHPVSGEIDIPDDVPITYKRLDPETLRSRLPVEEYNLAVVYVWCPGDQEGGGPGWRVTELVPLDSLQSEDDGWLGSIREADEYRQENLIKDALKETEQSVATLPGESLNGDDDDNDDDYWAQYDNTPARTPAQKASPLPRNTNYNNPKPAQSTTDDSYFSRYAEVQPALDNDDPSVTREDVGESSLNGSAVDHLLRRHVESVDEQQRLAEPETKQDASNEAMHAHDSVDYSAVPLTHPRPSSASSGSEAVSKLEQSAENQSAYEIGVKQHISSNIKSLFRLARSTGISKVEFESMVKRELETLDLLGIEDD